MPMAVYIAMWSLSALFSLCCGLVFLFASKNKQILHAFMSCIYFCGFFNLLSFELMILGIISSVFLFFFLCTLCVFKSCILWQSTWKVFVFHYQRNVLNFAIFSNLAGNICHIYLTRSGGYLKTAERGDRVWEKDKESEGEWKRKGRGWERENFNGNWKKSLSWGERKKQLWANDKESKKGREGVCVCACVCKSFFVGTFARSTPMLWGYGPKWGYPHYEKPSKIILKNGK